MTAAPRALPKVAYALVVVIVLMLVWQHTATVTLDDAYITYRYADNLAQHGRLFYNETGPSQLFATTAPVYAILLGGFGALGADIPTVGGWLSILAMIVAALALGDLLSEWFPWGAVLAALTLAIFPMSWLVLGMEGLPALALALLGFALSRRRRDGWAAVALAAATLLRFDAAAAALAWGIWLLLREGWRSAKVWRAAAVYLVTVVAVYGALMVLLGVPLPSTLGTKRAQVSLGITGFYSDTGYLKGLWLLARAYWEHSPWYLVIALLAVLGLLTILLALRKPANRAWFRASPFFALILWTLFHLALYTALGVTPYVWYYLPIAPLLAALAAFGLSAVVGFSRKVPSAPLRHLTGIGLSVALILGPLATHNLMFQRARTAGECEPVPEPTLADKALPGAQYRGYRHVGEWLAANTPVTATVGVTEVGIMGYYSRRSMVDFLGLLDADVSAALGRGDMSWGIYARQADYVAFSTVNPAYAYNPYEDAWFQGAYVPRSGNPACGFWGGPMVTYRRLAPQQAHGTATALPPTAEPLQVRFGDTFELVGVDAPPGPWRGGEAAGTTLYWRVLQQPQRDYKLFAHLVDADGRIIASRDQLPLLGERPTSAWQPSELLADFQPLGLPPLPIAPTTLQWEVGFYDPATGERLPAFGPDGAELPGGQARFGARELLPGENPVTLASDNCMIAIRGYRLDPPAVVRGGESKLTVDVSMVTCPVALTADVWDWAGNRAVWEQTAQVTREGLVEYTITAAADDPANWPGLRLRAEGKGERLRTLDDARHALGDTFNLTPIGLTGP